MWALFVSLCQYTNISIFSRFFDYAVNNLHSGGKTRWRQRKRKFKEQVLLLLQDKLRKPVPVPVPVLLLISWVGRKYNNSLLQDLWWFLKVFILNLGYPDYSCCGLSVLSTNMTCMCKCLAHGLKRQGCTEKLTGTLSSFLHT